MTRRAREAENGDGLRLINPTVVSKRAMLPWEREEEYLAILAALSEEHDPAGPTEEYLVDELAWTLWRKRRLAMAETTAFRKGLAGTMSEYGSTVHAALRSSDHSEGHKGWVERAVRATADETAEEIGGFEDADVMAQATLKLLDSKRADAYAAALAKLRQDVKEGWDWELENDPQKAADERVGYTADSKGLRKFLEVRVLPWCRDDMTELRGRALIKEQAYGEALGALRALDDHEAYLDRKLESTLDTLGRRQAARRSGGW